MLRAATRVLPVAARSQGWRCGPRPRDVPAATAHCLRGYAEGRGPSDADSDSEDTPSALPDDLVSGQGLYRDSFMDMFRELHGAGEQASRSGDSDAAALAREHGGDDLHDLGDSEDDEEEVNIDTTHPDPQALEFLTPEVKDLYDDLPAAAQEVFRRLQQPDRLTPMEKWQYARFDASLSPAVIRAIEKSESDIASAWGYTWPPPLPPPAPTRDAIDFAHVEDSVDQLHADVAAAMQAVLTAQHKVGLAVRAIIGRQWQWEFADLCEAHNERRFHPFLESTDRFQLFQTLRELQRYEKNLCVAAEHFVQHKGGIPELFEQQSRPVVD